MKTKPQEMLASEGGPKAVTKLGPFPSKLGREELWELIDLWEFSPEISNGLRKSSSMR